MENPKFAAHQGMLSGFTEEEKNSVDVLFLGTSNMFHTSNPVVLYEDTGITSFNFGSSSQSLNMTWMYFQEALKTQTPKVVCLEMLGCRDDLNHNLYEPGLRWGFTHFTNNNLKYKAIYQQLGKIDSEYLSYVFPLFRYKDRWKELKQVDFSNELPEKYWKGCAVSHQVTEVAYPETYWSTEDWELEESNRQMLDNIKNLCDEKGIELILFKSPTPTLWKNVYSKAVAEYADENNIPFIDYNTKLEELGISTKTDFMDAGHLNVAGSVKVTRDLGRYLKANYELKDHRNSGVNNSWDLAVQEKLRNQSNDKLNHSKNLEQYLMNIDNNDYVILYSFAGEIDENQKALLKKYCVNQEMDDIPENAVCVDGNLTFSSVSQEEYTWHDTVDGHDFAMECMRKMSEDGESIYEPNMYVDGKSVKVVEHGINFAVFDKRLGRVVSKAGFDADKNYGRVYGK